MDDFLSVLLDLVLLPYHLCKKMGGFSRLGKAPVEREIEHFWKKLGLVVALLVIGGIVLLAVFGGS